MLSRRSFLVASTITASALFANGLVAAEQEKKEVAKILAPKDGDKVVRVEDFKGWITKENSGWPVVVVRPLVGEEPWYIQPEVEEVTKNGLFSSRVFIGDARTSPTTRFQILILVAPSRKEAYGRFRRGMTMRDLPAELPASSFVTVVRLGKGRRESPPESGPRSIKFAGQTWEVKSGQTLGPGPNHFSDASENVWLDANGHLHLAITKHDSQSYCAEVVGPSLGYGEYRWVIAGNLSELDPQVVLGLFVYRNSDRAEIDFELARWGDPRKANSQFVVQPYGADSMYRFDSGQANVLTCSFFWHRGIVRGRCWVGEDISKKPLADWKYTGPKVPRPGGERVRVNLWLFEGEPPTTKTRQEVVIRSFHFEPAGQGEEG